MPKKAMERKGFEDGEGEYSLKGLAETSEGMRMHTNSEVLGSCGLLCKGDGLFHQSVKVFGSMDGQCEKDDGESDPHENRTSEARKPPHFPMILFVNNGEGDFEEATLYCGVPEGDERKSASVHSRSHSEEEDRRRREEEEAFHGGAR